MEDGFAIEPFIFLGLATYVVKNVRLAVAGIAKLLPHHDPIVA